MAGPIAMRMKLMIFAWMAAAACLPVLAVGQPQTQIITRDRAAAEETVSAARARAVAALYGEVSKLPLDDQVTVGSFLKDLGLKDRFIRETLQRADQIGSPRWIDEYTCQVHLEIPVSRLSYDLRRMAGSYPRTSPVSVTQIERAAADWPRRAYGAKGSCASPQKLVEIRPAIGGQWADVPDAARKKALSTASAQAAQIVVSSISAVSLNERMTLGNALERPEIGSPIRDWLASRPVGPVDFRDDLQVEVTLAVDAQEFLDVVHRVLDRQRDIRVPDWPRVERDFLTRLAPAVGRSGAIAWIPQAPQNVQIPNRAPDWVGQQIDVRGNASAVRNNKLLTRRAAEQDGLAKLQARIEALTLSPDLTVGDAGRRDRRIADAVSRAVRQSHVYKTDFRSDGSVVVSMTIDTRDIWEELGR